MNIQTVWIFFIIVNNIGIDEMLTQYVCNATEVNVAICRTECTNSYGKVGYPMLEL